MFRLRRWWFLLPALVLVVAACGDAGSSNESISTTDAQVVALTFDGTTCHYDGPEQVAEGTVDFLFTNTSDEPFAVAASSVEEYALADFLREGSVGADWDIPTGHPRSGGLEWHNRWPLVAVGDSHEFSWMLPAGTYYFDCVLNLDHVWRVAQLQVGTEATEPGAASPQPTHVVGGDLLLVMQPGEGTGTDTGRVMVEMFDSQSNFGVREGTANHVGWIDARYGPRHVVTFTAGRENPRGGDPEFCVFIIPGGGGCGIDPEKPQVYGWGEDSAELFAGPEGVEAVITTTSGNTVSILTAEGYAYAEWPIDWGLPQSVEFYSSGGLLLTAHTVPQDSETGRPESER